MNHFDILCTLLAQQTQGAPAGGGSGGPGGGMSTLVMMALFMVIFWVLLIRPQQRRQKEHNARLAALKKGDRVIIAGGIHGLIEAVREQSLSVKIAEGVRVDVEKAGVTTVLPKDEPAAPVPVEVARNGK